MPPAVTAGLREISQAGTRAAALAAIESFKQKSGAEYARGAPCLIRDTEALLAFRDVPAKHWDHLRISNPVESLRARA